MINTSSVRNVNLSNFNKCVELRKQGLSYSEIKKQVPVAKSTLNNWLTLSGLTLTAEHLNIQRTKRLQNHVVATEASRVSRNLKKEKAIKEFTETYQKFIQEPLFVAGVMLYIAEGSKKGACRFSNSDHRLIETFIKFIETYFPLKRSRNISFRLYVHETRKKDLPRIKKFWSDKLSIPEEKFSLSWKRNIVKHRRKNQDYVGQVSAEVQGESFLFRKLLSISSIMLKTYCGIVQW